MVPMLRPLWQGCLTFTPLANRPAGYLQFPTALLLYCFTAAAVNAAAAAGAEEG